MAEYAEFTVDDFETFLKRAFRSLRFKPGVTGKERHYVARLDDGKSDLKVLSTIGINQTSNRGVGSDTIKVLLFYNGPRKTYTIIKRVQGWRNNLQDRIEEAIEDYESWRADQLALNAEVRVIEDDPESRLPSSDDPEGQAEAEAAGVYDDPQARAVLERQRREQEERAKAQAAKEQLERERLEREKAETRRPQVYEPSKRIPASWATLRSGEWGIKVQGRPGPNPGDTVYVARKNETRSTPKVVTEKVWEGNDYGQWITVWKVAQTPRNAAESEPE